MPERVTLHDASSGSTAEILTGFGFNCYRFAAAGKGGPVEVLYAEEGFADGTKRPSGSGIPLLFPFPGRIRGTSLEFEGRRCELQPGDGRGNAIHGLVLNRPWRVIERSRSEVVGEFCASQDGPDLLDRWPADFRIRASYALSGAALRSEIDIENPDEKPLPFGLGVHPYFRLPLGRGGSAEDCVVRVGASKRWELEEMMPTGRCTPLRDDESLAEGMEFGRMQFDDVLSGLEFDDGVAIATISDPHSGSRLTVRFGREFRECVVYNPPHRRAVCIEPYTCVPNAPELAARNVDAGWQVLRPGETFSARIEYRLD